MISLGDAWPDQRAAVWFYQLGDGLLCGQFFEAGVLVTPADQFTSQQPEIVAMASQCLWREFAGQQVEQERAQAFDDITPDREIMFVILPALRPAFHDKRRADRPLLQTADPAATVGRLMNEREPIYRFADLTIASRDVPHDKIVDECIEALYARLCGKGGSPAQSTGILGIVQ